MSAVAALLAVWLIAGVGLANGIHGGIPWWFWFGWIWPGASFTVGAVWAALRAWEGDRS